MAPLFLNGRCMGRFPNLQLLAKPVSFIALLKARPAGETISLASMAP
jgi:hypothetical protein